VPLIDKNGNSIGFYDLIIDQTHIKKMLNFYV